MEDETPSLSKLTTIPRQNGKPLYINGIPVPAEAHYLDAMALSELFYILNETFGFELTFTGDEILFIKEYLIYYLMAPCFIFVDPNLNNILYNALAIEGISDILNVVKQCNDIGLKPFIERMV